MVTFPALLALAATLFSTLPDRSPVPASGLRALVLERYNERLAEWEATRRAGANLVVTLGPPDARTDELAGAFGLKYLAFLSTDEIPLFARDPARISEALSERNLAGFYYYDTRVLEGFTTPEAQRDAYTTLKSIFPDKIVLYPTRLDPIAWSPDFLDRYFRPEFTDFVTPYFYPVGTTIIGEARENDPWRLGELLAALAPRLPPGKEILPVLQGFEQIGYPVSSSFLLRQFAIYRGYWPDLENAAVYAWRFGLEGPGPLVEIAGRPDLEEGVCRLFRSLARTAGCRAGRIIPWR